MKKTEGIKEIGGEFGVFPVTVLMEIFLEGGAIELLFWTPAVGNKRIA